MPANTGKPGTIAPEEFTELSAAATQYGAKRLAQKVAKACSRIAATYNHESPGSPIASAWDAQARKVVTTLGETTSAVNTGTFSLLMDLVRTYGPEVVVQKLGKIAQRSGNATEAQQLKAVFPRNTNRAA